MSTPSEKCPKCGSSLKKSCVILNENTEVKEKRFGYGVACPKWELGLCDYGYIERELTTEEMKIWGAGEE